ncbi:hypothetical protein TrLO_g9113 [Triparma laevis f. longispina]|uniref:Uncharacterized protein n=1 Tax=Triparma laevis f. longispina TaxID=1714387 RepID=A0A9W7FTC2_9STRA|nr:hypothetical protein TrLO_g9113 [Triparma laevis f. longispina]
MYSSSQPSGGFHSRPTSLPFGSAPAPASSAPFYVSAKKVDPGWGGVGQAPSPPRCMARKSPTHVRSPLPGDGSQNKIALIKE